MVASVEGRAALRVKTGSGELGDDLPVLGDGGTIEVRGALARDELSVERDLGQCSEAAAAAYLCDQEMGRSRPIVDDGEKSPIDVRVPGGLIRKAQLGRSKWASCLGYVEYCEGAI
jgi:hypothetical protein